MGGLPREPLAFPMTNGMFGLRQSLLVVSLCFFAGCAVARAGGGGAEPPAAASAYPVVVPFRSAPEPSPQASDPGAGPIPVSAGDAQWGRPDALVTIVEFSDFQCPFCSRVQATLHEIQRVYGPDQVRIVWKHAPLPFHPHARPAHEAAAAVFGLGGSVAFFKFHDRAFANQQALGEQSYEQWAVEAGVGRHAFHQALAAKRYAPKVDADLALAQTVDATATPSFRINGVTLEGAQPIEAFRRVIDQELGQAKALLAQGTRAADIYLLRTAQNVADSPAKPDSDESAEDTTVWKVPVDPDDPVRGPRDALVTVVEWSDYQCPFCQRVEATLTELLRDYGPDVRVVWKDNPLPFHKRALPAAILARTAFEQRGNKPFWNVHDALFASAPDLEDPALGKIARQFGVSWPVVQAAIARGKTPPKIESAMDLAEDLKAQGTPHFFINGVRLAGAQPIEKFKARIDEERDKARARLGRGVRLSDLYDDIMRDGRAPPPPERKVVKAPSASSATRGPASAPVVIQVWSDFQCPFCKRGAANLAEVEKEFTGSVRIVWRHLPLSFHPNAEQAAEAAEEVLAQKGAASFWKYHDRLFEAQADPGGLERPNLEKLAAALGVNLVRFNAALDSGRHRAKVAADADAARDAGIDGTPTFAINGYVLHGAEPTRVMRRAIRRALAEKRKP
jgi:protein-disulfide isomerase